MGCERLLNGRILKPDRLLVDDEQLWLFHKDIDETKAITQYFPQSEVQYGNAEKTSWRGTIRIGGNPAKTYVMLARVGDSGRKLCQYYSKVVQETGQYPSIVELTEDIIECDCQELRL